MSDNGTAARGAGEATPAAGVAAVAAGAATNLEQRARMAGLPVLEGAAPPNIGQVSDADAAGGQRQKIYYDSGRRDVAFQVGEEVLLGTKNIKLRGVGDATTTPKLMPK